MYVTVRLLNGFKKPLTYKIPENWGHIPRLSDIISVPLQKRTELAYITGILENLQESPSFEIKQALEQQPLPNDPLYHTFIQKLAHYYAINPFIFYKRFAQYLDASAEAPAVEGILTIPDSSRAPAAGERQLTPAQNRVISELLPFFHEPKFQSLVLHGVTGSGKTEIYKVLIKTVLQQGKNVLFLLPEVSLAVQFTHILKNAFTETPVFGFHSATGAAEKRALWRHLYTQNGGIIIGVHLPLLLPLARLGTIIIDEEHDIGYQEKKIPRINTKEAALLKAQLLGIPVVLGSATPSISSLYNVEQKGWKLCTLTERYKGTFPEVQVVQLDKKNKEHFWISKELKENITHTLAAGNQVIIFLNRRGYSFFVQCMGCDFIFSCPHCSVSLTYHEDNRLHCHYCGIKKDLPSTCPTCKEPEKNFFKKGIGTQQVVTMLQKLFPTARIARADLDSTVNKKKWQQIITHMYQGNLDILVGTQTITKGYHFPRVTLVGVLWADSNIHFPFYNAAETALTQLIQVAGRAGRDGTPGKVIIQTLAPHPIFSFINEKDYQAFYKYESDFRKELRYPPYIRFAEIELRHEDEQRVLQDALACAAMAQRYPVQKELTILGPAQPVVHKIQNIFMQKIYLKSESMADLLAIYRAVEALPLQSARFFTPHPLS